MLIPDLFLFLTVTIARAIELKHNATLIAALSFETANFYQKAGVLQCLFCLCKTVFNNREVYYALCEPDMGEFISDAPQ